MKELLPLLERLAVSVLSLILLVGSTWHGFHGEYARAAYELILAFYLDWISRGTRK